MNTIFEEAIQELAVASDASPCISVVLPFEPKMQPSSVLRHRLHTCYYKVMKQLKGRFSEEAIAMTSEKLLELIHSADYTSYRKSIALLASPDVAQILYLDFAVEERIIVDSFFDIRHLLYSKKYTIQYLALVLHQDYSYRIIAGNADKLTTIISHSLPAPITGQNAEVKTPHRFVTYLDSCLTRILQAYPFPLFVMGDTSLLAAFQTHSSLSAHVIGYIQGSFENATGNTLSQLLQPYVSTWQQVHQKSTLAQLNGARRQSKLEYGICNVWKTARQGNGRLLVIEKGLTYATAGQLLQEYLNMAATEAMASPYAGDPVDAIIEAVLMNGGDVEFVNAGMLGAYEQIALIKHF